MIDKSSLLKSQGSLYLEFIPKDGLFHKMLLLLLMGFLTGRCNLFYKGSLSAKNGRELHIETDGRLRYVLLKFYTKNLVKILHDKKGA